MSVWNDIKLLCTCLVIFLLVVFVETQEDTFT